MAHHNSGHHGAQDFELMMTEDHSSELGHVVPFKMYLLVLVILLVLTIVTVAVAYFDFGAWNVVVAMLVASAKAMLVALFFMHLKYEKLTTWIYAIFPLVLLAVLMGGIFIDNPYRSTRADIVGAP